jgi:hypothetical protein
MHFSLGWHVKLYMFVPYLHVAEGVISSKEGLLV